MDPGKDGRQTTSAPTGTKAPPVGKPRSTRPRLRRGSDFRGTGRAAGWEGGSPFPSQR